MKKFLRSQLFVLLSAMAVGTPGYAQYGNTVRQGIVWDNIFENQDMYDWNNILYTAENGYHFDGEREADGKTYAVYRDGDGKEVALLREDGGRVYIHIPPGKYFGNISGDSTSDEKVMEGLLYDFTAKAGDKVSGVFSETVDMEEGDNYIPHEMTVLDTFTVRIDGKQMRGQHIMSDRATGPGIIDELIIIEGIGSNFGMLQAPQLIWPTTGGKTTYGFIDKVKDESGKIIFTRYDFLRFYKYAEKEHYTETNSLIREDRVWNYQMVVQNLDGEIMEKTQFPNYHFNGTEEIDGITYHRFLDGDDNIVALMRQDGDKVYLYLDDDKYPELGDGEVVPSRDMLMYDFGAQAGMDYNSVGFDDGNGVCSCLVNITIADDFTVNVHDCDYLYQWLDVIQTSSNTNSYLVVGGVGPQRGRLDNPQWGLQTSAATYTYWQLETMTDLEGNILFEYKDFVTNDNPNHVDGVVADSGLYYNGTVYTTTNAQVSVFDLSGKRVAEGRGSVSTAGLQPGVYVAKTAGQSLKIVVR